jgi:hypothetical protein
MPEPELDPEVLAAEAVKMTDEELIDTWETASEQEKADLPPLLRAIVNEMGQRGIPFRNV